MLISINSFAKQISEIKAKQVATEFYFERINLQEKTEWNDLIFECVHTEYSDNIALFYVFNRLNNNGFIIISANDALKPVFAYSLKNNFRMDNMPTLIKRILYNYTKKQNIALEINLKANKETAELWENSKSVKDINAVGPLLSTTWAQGEFYNDDCPPYFGCPGGHAQANGAGVALAQIMKYYEYPTNGTSSESYYHFQFGTLSANFGNTTYQWDQMPDHLTSSNSHVAEIIYHAAIGMRTCFALPSEARTYFNSNLDQVLWGSPKNVLDTYFGYSTNSEYKTRSDYTEQEWVDMIKAQIDLNQPVLSWGYVGQDLHWVFDGYDGNNIHFNFGFNGQYDGFYDIIDDNQSGDYALINIYPSTYTSNTEITNSEINIYPNPSKGIFNVSLNNNLNNSELIIYNNLGNVVLQKSISSNQTPVVMSNQSKGVYFVKIINEKITTVKTIIIE